MREIDANELNCNVFDLIGSKWMLVTAGDEQGSNTMTASWGGLGVIWGKPSATVYVRPQRYTKEFVDAQEVECAAIGNPDDPATVSTTRPGEILAGAEFYTYDDKYKNGVSQTVIPAHLSEEKLDEVRTEARRAYLALGCAGLSRCDFFVERGTGRVLCNELNTLPGFTSISMYPKLMEHEGLSYAQLVDRLLQLALHRRKGAY